MNKLFINSVILFFAMLFLFNIYNANKKVIENMEDAGSGPEYKDYKDDPGILAQQNAGNIKVLRGQVDKILSLVNKIQPKQKEMTDSIKQNAVQINAIMQGKQDNVNNKTGMNSKHPPSDITGLD
jgi:hypothetical protein